MNKGLFLYNTLSKEIIDNDELQKDWLIKNEESLVDEYVENKLCSMSNDEFDMIMSKYGENNG